MILDQRGNRISPLPDLPSPWSDAGIPKTEPVAEPLRRQRDAILFSIDFPYQMVWYKRPKGWRLWLLRIRHAPYDLYFAIRSRLQPSWLDE
jgi:hypothetical protein